MVGRDAGLGRPDETGCGFGLGRADLGRADVGRGGHRSVLFIYLFIFNFFEMFYQGIIRCGTIYDFLFIFLIYAVENSSTGQNILHHQMG